MVLPLPNYFGCCFLSVLCSLMPNPGNGTAEAVLLKLVCCCSTGLTGAAGSEPAKKVVRGLAAIRGGGGGASSKPTPLFAMRTSGRAMPRRMPAPPSMMHGSVMVLHAANFFKLHGPIPQIPFSHCSKLS